MLSATIHNPAIGREIARQLAAENLANDLAEALTPKIHLLLQEESQAAGCKDCRKTRKAAKANPCPEDGAGPYCEAHQGSHMAQWHMETELWEQHLGCAAAKFMAEQGLFLTGCHDEQTSHVLIRLEEKPASRTGHNHKRSLWYPLAQRLGMSPGIVTTWRYPNADDGETVEKLQAAVKRFCALTGLEIALWTNGSSGITLFLAPAGKTEGVRILPENPYEPAENQDSLSGIRFNQTSKPAKIAKRMSALRFADGICLTDEPSYIQNGDPHIKLPDGSRLNVEVKDTTYVSQSLALQRGAGDGNGAIRQSAARTLLRLAGITRKLGRIRKIQVNIMGGDFFMKGVFRIIPDDRFQGGPATDLIVDSDSISRQVTNSRFTLIRLIRKDFKPQTGFVYIEPLLQADLAERLLGAEELAEAQARLMPKLHDQAYKEAWRSNNERSLQAVEEETESHLWETARDQENVHLDAALSLKFSEGMFDAARRLSGLFAHPRVMQTQTGWIAAKAAAKQRRANPQAGIFAHGATVGLSAAPYSVPPEGKTGVTEPKPGYARLVWDHKHPDHLTEICLARKDAHRLDQALDTSDCDDDLTLIFVTNPDGDPGVLILKLPMSTEGGAILRINREDARKLGSLGYHFYPVKGSRIHPELHEEHEDGSPRFPDALHPRQLEESELPKWTTDPNEAVESLVYLRRYRAQIGRATNLMAVRYQSLDQGGHPMWDPRQEKFEMSAAIVDPVENGDQDPTVITEALVELTYRDVNNGHSIDECLAGRVGKALDEHHRKAAGPEAPPLSITTGCHHEGRKKALNQLVIEETRKADFRASTASGPIDRWYDEPFPRELAGITATAIMARDEAWKTANAEARAFSNETFEWTNWDGEVRKRPAHTRQEIKTYEAILKRDARLAERKAAEEAYNKASALEGYRPGQFHAMWSLLWLYRKDGETLSTYSLAGLPDKEHEAYYGSGISRPLMALKPNHREKAEGVKPGDVLRLVSRKEGKETHCYLQDPKSGKDILRVNATKTAKNAAPKGKVRTLTVNRALADPEGKEKKSPLLIMSPNMEPR